MIGPSDHLAARFFYKDFCDEKKTEDQGGWKALPNGYRVFVTV
jgi:hypothetical protein